MNTNRTLRWSLILALLVWVALASGQEADTSPNMSSHHQAQSNAAPQQCPMMGMKDRADKGMGFDQAKTTHHFLLKPDGGVISVEANDAKDTESRDQVRMHLEHIAQAFATGDFEIPMFVHDETPPGVPVMKARRDQISYRFEETENGGRVVISSRDADARTAIHEFLAFQIREHKTGDSLTMP
jgi:hypothetical protein